MSWLADELRDLWRDGRLGKVTVAALAFGVLVLIAAPFGIASEGRRASECADRGGVWLDRDNTCIDRAVILGP